MKSDLLNYLNYLKCNDSYLFNNYKSMYLFFLALFKNEQSIFSKLEVICNSNYSFSMYSEDNLLDYVYDFYNSISNDLADKFYKSFVNRKIIYKTDIEKSHFTAYRNKDSLKLDDYIIYISKTNTIKDSFNMVHEYTHYLINKINENKNISKSIINI